MDDEASRTFNLKTLVSIVSGLVTIERCKKFLEGPDGNEVVTSNETSASVEILREVRVLRERVNGLEGIQQRVSDGQSSMGRRDEVQESLERSASNEITNELGSRRPSTVSTRSIANSVLCDMARNLLIISDASSPKHAHIGLLKVFANAAAMLMTYDLEGAEQ